MASVPSPIGKSVLKGEKKSGQMPAILLLPGTLPFMSAYVALPQQVAKTLLEQTEAYRELSSSLAHDDA